MGRREVGGGGRHAWSTRCLTTCWPSGTSATAGTAGSPTTTSPTTTSRCSRHFIPCGVWEAVYIIEGLLKQRSDAEPDTIHADTQGQSYPVHALAHLFGFELLPRIRNWKDLIFYRARPRAVYRHIDALFGEPGQNVIDWELIATHWRDLMRIAISIREGRLSSTLLLRRLSTESRRNNVYKAFRELGRAIRTITLLRFDLRARAARADRRRDEQGRVLQQLLRLARVRRRGDRAQRPRRAGEADQVQHAARQLRDPPHRARHDRRRPRPPSRRSRPSTQTIWRR